MGTPLPGSGRTTGTSGDALQDEADALRDAATTLFPRWQVASQPDPAMNERAAAALQQARDAYARGIEAVQLSVQRIG